MTKSVAAADLEALKRVAEEATPGPWHREMIELGNGGPMTLGVGSPTDPICIVNGIVESPLGNRNVRYLVAANPAVVLSLITELEQLRKASADPMLLGRRRWVACSEYAPGETDVCLVLFGDDQQAVAFHCGGVWFEDYDGGTDGERPFRGEVTHWMILPDSPAPALPVEIYSAVASGEDES